MVSAGRGRLTTATISKGRVALSNGLCGLNRGPARLRGWNPLNTLALTLCVSLFGCVTGPRALQETRLQYNEIVKSTTEQQLLLNIVRLRYTDTPSSLSIASVAAQFEVAKSLQLMPFFVASGAEPNRSYAAVLPQVGVVTADRPTFSLVPLDDQEFTRK